MKLLKTALLICVTAAAAVSVTAPAASAPVHPMDVCPDGIIDCFDVAMARKKGLSAAEIKSIQDYVLGRGYTAPLPETDVTIDESCILEPKGTVHTGEGTFYGGGYEGGCAMLDPVSRDYWIVAMNLADYNDAQLAGAYLEVTGELGTINMLVTDLLPEGKKGDLDLYVDAFPLIAPAEKGRVPVSWKIVPLDSAENAPVSYKYKEGTTEFWCGIQVRNHRYPITRLEYLDENGEFQEIKRRPYNYFESDKMGAGPFTFRITDIYGQMIIDENIPLSYDDTEIIQGHVQFPE
ncbi:MAG: hypothetical protein J6B01_08935 [Ruminococcus sp.]|nr:hypothetical protein [Ruminococcus sp.]